MEPNQNREQPKLESAKELQNQAEQKGENSNELDKQDEYINLNELQTNKQDFTTITEQEKVPEISSINQIHIIGKGKTKKKNKEKKGKIQNKKNQENETDTNVKVQSNEAINQLAQQDEYYSWMVELEKAKKEVGFSQQKIAKISAFLKISAQRIFQLQNNTSPAPTNAMSSASCISVADRACQYLYEQSKIQENTIKHLKDMNVTVDILFFLTHLPLSAVSDCFISLLCQLFKDMPLSASINLFNMGVIEHLIPLLNHPYSEIREKTIESICYIICAQIQNTYQLHKHPYYKGLQTGLLLDKIFSYINSPERTNKTRAYAAVILGLVYQGVQMSDIMIKSVVRALARQLKPGNTEKIQKYILEALYVVAQKRQSHTHIIKNNLIEQLTDVMIG